jgi:hypothetical protein
MYQAASIHDQIQHSSPLHRNQEVYPHSPCITHHVQSLYAESPASGWTSIAVHITKSSLHRQSINASERQPPSSQGSEQQISFAPSTVANNFSQPTTRTLGHCRHTNTDNVIPMVQRLTPPSVYSDPAQELRTTAQYAQHSRAWHSMACRTVFAMLQNVSRSMSSVMLMGSLSNHSGHFHHPVRDDRIKNKRERWVGSASLPATHQRSVPS